MIPNTETLCTDCGKACGWCSWSKEGEPVKGWTAEKTRKGYSVKECPEFVSDREMIARPENFDTDGCLELLKAVGAVMKDDYIKGKGRYARDYRKPESVMKAVRMNRQDIEKFLLSGYGRTLMMLTRPECLIDQLRREAARYDRTQRWAE